ncbi:MAG: type I restriction endonuclease subunit R [Proteobacteria bacterium]|nr:type I restriction endonuclease subunit R [Pseudomonadota bacterium]
MTHGHESDHEQATIERLQLLGYEYLPGPDIDRDDKKVVLTDILKSSLAYRYADLNEDAINLAVEKLTRPDGVDTLHRNRSFHVDMLTKGFELPVERPVAMAADVHRPSSPPGERDVVHIHPIDWDNPAANRFHVVNQLTITGKNTRRPDIIVYVNGLPLVVFELKNPYAEKPTVKEAFNQIGHYTIDIPQLFEFNSFCVLSDGNSVLHGMWTAGMEWYAPWKSIDGHNVEPGEFGSMKSLIEGLFPKERLLDYIRNFIVYEVDKKGIVKKGAKYHQFFAVQVAVERTHEAFAAEGDKRIGVIWHTTGSGKSLSMTFLVGILRDLPELKNPTFVVQVDRTDLDDQLHDQFTVARSLVGDVKHADSVDDLRDLLSSGGGEVIFTTIEKFALKRGPDGKVIETAHPVLSERGNIIVIADEAHRSQYGFLQGFARYLNEALPNAKRLGFTGTPISFSKADTQEVFGDYIHTYDIRQSQEDGATVAIYYTPRQAKLHLSDADIDKALDESAAEVGVETSDIENRKSRWAALAKLAGADDRMKELAQDILAHFKERTATLDGKAMIVCMTRANCVRLYGALTTLPGCPEVKVVMTGNIAVDPKEWNEAGHITTKSTRDGIKKRLIDSDDPLKIAIVCDMWLTGTDIPCLHTLYVDKPMRGHNMIQAISRVNRVFRDKPHGLIVDYIGIGDQLREATNTYTKGGGTGNPAPEVGKTALPIFFACLEEIRGTVPEGVDYGHWRHLSAIEFEDLHHEAYVWLVESEERGEAFLRAELRLTKAYLLVQHLDEARPLADEVICFQRIRNELKKSQPGPDSDQEMERAVRDLVDDHVESDGVVDIFKLAGIQAADISILDDDFLQTFKDKPHENLRLKLLAKLMGDEIRHKAARNLAKAKSFRELLQNTLDRYHKRVIDAATVVQTILEMKKEMDADARRTKLLGLSEEELAFYDAVHENYAKVYDEPLLRDLIHEVVQVIKKNLKVDWTESHREDVKAAVRAAAKRALRKRGVKKEDFDPLLEKLMQQAEALWKEWPVVA